MWLLADLVWTDVLEDLIASVFRVEESASEEPAWAAGYHILPVHADSLLADFSTLKMEVIHSSEKSVLTRPTRRHIPEDGILHSHRCENLKSYTLIYLFDFWLSLILATICLFLSNYVHISFSLLFSSFHSEVHSCGLRTQTVEHLRKIVCSRSGRLQHLQFYCLFADTVSGWSPVPVYEIKFTWSLRDKQMCSLSCIRWLKIITHLQTLIKPVCRTTDCISCPALRTDYTSKSARFRK
jgi:hypothetical protein